MTGPGTRFPSSVDALDAELMSEVLAEQSPGVRVERLQIVHTDECGDGFASTADRVVLDLEYAAGHDAGLPRRMLLKTMLARPHAPEAMYSNEVRFYREVRPALDIETPAVYASLFDPDSGQFGVAMEDLRERSARFPNATTPVGVDQIRGLVETLAGLHAAYWQSPRFASDLDWLATPCSGGMYPIFKGFGYELISDQLAKNAFKRELIAPLGHSFERLWEKLWKLQAILDAAPHTLLHGDPHIANTYLLPDARGGLLDWQLMVRGRYAHDLTYLLVTGLDTPLRRQHERELIAHYLDRLAAGGVSQPPDMESAWELHRRTVLWGLVIGWLITPPVNYGEEITRANLTRLVTAAQDLETLQALD
jgi:hypothetical protein